MPYNYDESLARTQSDLVLAALRARLAPFFEADQFESCSVTGGAASTVEPSIKSFHLSVVYYENFEENDYGQDQTLEEENEEVKLILEAILDALVVDYALLRDTYITYDLSSVKKTDNGI